MTLVGSTPLDATTVLQGLLHREPRRSLASVLAAWDIRDDWFALRRATAPVRALMEGQGND